MTLTKYRYSYQNALKTKKKEMRKRRETQKGGLSSAQATRKPSFDKSQGTAFTKDNVAEQQKQAKDKLHEVQNLLNGIDLDEVASIGMAITLSAIKQKSNMSVGIARKLFQATIEAMAETFFKVTIPSIITENLKKILHE